jgi:UDP-N-acetylglucosamine 2-epimerase (non-hydrolysing)
MSQPSPPKILYVVGARPNFMKIAPIMAALRQPRQPGTDLKSVPAAAAAAEAVLVHTGQHYDPAMNESFFEDLGIPAPNINLEVGSSTHAVQTADIMRRFEPVLDTEKPAAILVVGDVNSTIACALVAAKKGVPVIHVEAGLRSYDRTMPEEINRVLTDQISDLLFTTERGALENLRREGIDPEHVHFVGNVMIDSLMRSLEKATPSTETLASTGLNAPEAGYTLLTLHRPSNVDDANVLARLLDTFRDIADRLPIVFPMHPRTRARIESAGLQGQLEHPGLHLLPPINYLAMLGLMRDARMVLTDSGGIQEETTALGVPCITLRNNTERPITIDEGTNVIVGQDPQRIRDAVDEVLRTGGKAGRIPEYWDGRAAERIVRVLRELYGNG